MKPSRNRSFVRDQATEHMLALCVSALAFVLALFFVVFTCIMFFEQYDVMRTGTPGVDAMQGRWNDEEGRIPLKEGVRKLCGEESFSWRWFLPVMPRKRGEESKKDK